MVRSIRSGNATVTSCRNSSVATQSMATKELRQGVGEAWVRFPRAVGRQRVVGSSRDEPPAAGGTPMAVGNSERERDDTTVAEPQDPTDEGRQDEESSSGQSTLSV